MLWWKMSDKKTDELTNDVLLADALLRLKTLETILVNKGIFTREEFQTEMEGMTKVIAKFILERAKVPGDLDKIISDM